METQVGLKKSRVKVNCALPAAGKTRRRQKLSLRPVRVSLALQTHYLWASSLQHGGTMFSVCKLLGAWCLLTVTLGSWTSPRCPRGGGFIMDHSFQEFVSRLNGFIASGQEHGVVRWSNTVHLVTARKQRKSKGQGSFLQVSALHVCLFV